MRMFEISAPEMIQAKHGAQARDAWTICDTLSELIDAPKYCATAGSRSWAGGTTQEAEAWARNGKPELVALSDAIMAKLESAVEAIVTPKRRTIDDMAGSVPNIPAFIAGLPCAMRRTIRDESNHTPLCAMVDIGASAAITKDVMTARGAAILALVRMLSARRAIELYAATTNGQLFGRAKGARYLVAPLDSAPLDTGRAAFVLCDPAAPRALFYPRTIDFDDGPWPYFRGALSVSEMVAVFKQAFPGKELLCIPGARRDDTLISNPEAWVLEKLRQYGEHMEQD